jgi:hypothetical protein
LSEILPIIIMSLPSNNPIRISHVFNAASMMSNDPLTASDLDDFERRIGNRSPTPQDAIRFSDLSIRLTRVLSHSDIDKYRSAVEVLRKPKLPKIEQDSAKAIIRQCRDKALSASVDDQSKLKKQRERQEDIRGLRVRLVADPSQRGMIPFRKPGEYVLADMKGIRFAVHFDGESKPSEAQYYRSDLRLLCAACDTNDGKYRCSKCQREPYCSSECQRAAWREHKLCCGKTKSESVSKAQND